MQETEKPHKQGRGGGNTSFLLALLFCRLAFFFVFCLLGVILHHHVVVFFIEVIDHPAVGVALIINVVVGLKGESV